MCSALGFCLDIWGNKLDLLPGVYKWLLKFCCFCSKFRNQLLQFWVCSFGEEYFLNRISLVLIWENLKISCKSETGELSQSYRLNPTSVSCSVTGIPLLYCVFLPSFSPPIPCSLLFLAGSSQLNSFSAFLPLISKGQVWVKNCFRLFIFPSSAPLNSLPLSSFSYCIPVPVPLFSLGISLDWS